MKKNKEWLKNEVEDYLAIEGVYDARTALKAVLEYIDQLDEPNEIELSEPSAWKTIAKLYHPNEVYWGNVRDSYLESLDEPEKVVIPQFVADWYEKNKRDLTFGIYMVMKGIIKKHDSECSKIEDWFNHSIHNPVETVVLMKSGYTIEKEPTWTVKLDNGRYVDNFVEFALGIQIDITSKLDCTAPIRFKDKSKAEAVALLVSGEIVEVTDNV